MVNNTSIDLNFSNIYCQNITYVFAMTAPKEKLLSNEYGGSGLNLRSGFLSILLSIYCQELSKSAFFSYFVLSSCQFTKKP